MGGNAAATTRAVSVSGPARSLLDRCVMLRYVILALLQEAPDYGYHLKQRFDARTGGAWLLNIGQVYQTLQCLERAGLVVATLSKRDGRHVPRRVFAISAKGVRALARWLHRPPGRTRPLSDELLLRLLVGGPACVRPHLAAQEEQCREALTRLSDTLADPARPLECVQRLCVEAERLNVLARLAWLERCRDHPTREGADATCPSLLPA